jgi:hypothetical protein
MHDLPTFQSRQKQERHRNNKPSVLLKKSHVLSPTNRR